MKFRTILLALPLLGTLNGCLVDRFTTVEEIYTNETSYTVEMTGYRVMSDSCRTRVWTITPDASLMFEYTFATPCMCPSMCDSLKVTFDDGRQITYRGEGGPYERRSREDISKYRVRCRYCLTEEMHDAAR